VNRKALSDHTTQYDTGDVTWEVEETKRADVVKIILRTDSRFNLIKIWLTLRMIVEKMDAQMDFIDNADADNKQ
jgi:hypothetical protein